MPASPKLNAAFRAMRKGGLLAYQNYRCCSGCGGAAIANEAEDRIAAGKATKNDIKGCCFYHSQDAESRDVGRPFYLAYGSISSQKHDDIGLDTVEIGRLVCAALKAAGVRFAWDGKAHTRIQVIGWGWGE